LAATLTNMGVLLEDEGKRQEALKAYEQARDIAAKLVKDHPEVPVFRNDLAGTLYNTAILRRQMKQAKEALADLDLALKHLHAVLKVEPRSIVVADPLWRVLFLRASILSDLKRHAEAAADWSKVVLVAPAQYRVFGRFRRAESLARAGRGEQAMTEAESVAR